MTVQPQIGSALILTEPRFRLGQVVITRAAAETLDNGDVIQTLQRHVKGDWGDVCPEDWQANELALKNDSRLLSSYNSQSGTKFWIITEWDRSVTTILLPEDY